MGGGAGGRSVRRGGARGAWVMALLLATPLSPARGEELVYHRVFVTGNTYNVNSGAFSGPNARRFADMECTWAAYDAGWIIDWDFNNPVYTAFLSHRNEPIQNARDRLNLQGPIINTQFQTVWSNPATYLSTPPMAPWAVTEFGGGPSLDTVWTGSNLEGGQANDCNGWTDPFAAGDHGSVFSASMGDVSSGCQGSGQFLCFGPAGVLPCGSTQINPRVPGDEGQEYVFQDAATGRWYSLPAVSRLDFTAEGSAHFALAQLPFGYYADYEVIVEGESLGTFAANETINFVALTGAAVESFSLHANVDGGNGGGDEYLKYAIRLQFTAPTASFAVVGADPPVDPPPGDYNGDGEVTAADYVVWRNTLGSTTDLAADGNHDGVVDAEDYLFWKDKFGSSSVAATAPDSTPVPEPAAAGLALAGILAVVGWRLGVGR